MTRQTQKKKTSSITYKPLMDALFWISIILILLGLILIFGGKKEEKDPGRIPAILPPPGETIKSDSLFRGYYLRERVTIRASETTSFDDYLDVAIHEYGHHVWFKYFTRQDFKDWMNATDTCGYQSEYAKHYKGRSLKMEEEYADDLVGYYRGTNYCLKKEEVLKRYGRQQTKS